MNYANSIGNYFGPYLPAPCWNMITWKFMGSYKWGYGGSCKGSLKGSIGFRGGVMSGGV